MLPAIDTSGYPPLAAHTGSPTGISTTTSGSGKGSTVDVTITSRQRHGDHHRAPVVLGYVVGDTITIDGGDMGGTSVTNDLTVTITTASAFNWWRHRSSGAHQRASSGGSWSVCGVRSDFSIDLSGTSWT